jgi:hypothetical protein
MDAKNDRRVFWVPIELWRQAQAASKPMYISAAAFVRIAVAEKLERLKKAAEQHE